MLSGQILFRRAQSKLDVIAVKVKSGEVLQVKGGAIPHSKLIGVKYGSKVRLCGQHHTIVWSIPIPVYGLRWLQYRVPNEWTELHKMLCHFSVITYCLLSTCCPTM